MKKSLKTLSAAVLLAFACSANTALALGYDHSSVNIPSNTYNNSYINTYCNQTWGCP